MDSAPRLSSPASPPVAAGHWLHAFADATAVPPPGFVRRALAKGALLSTPAEPDDRVFVVRSGRLRVYLAGGNHELTLSYLAAGDIYTTHTPTYVEAVAPSELWLIGTAAFARQLAGDPAVTPATMRVLGRLLADAVHLIEDLAFREVPARLARFLLGLARRSQPVEGGCLVPLDLGMGDIASLLGTTRQTVSSLINQWQRDGLVRRHGRRQLLLCSLDALAARCRDADA